MLYLIVLFLMFLVNMKKFKDSIYIQNTDLKDYCTFKIGGKAKHLFIVYSISSLLNVCSYCNTHNIKYKIIGQGSNLLFDDKGYNGAIIVNESDKFIFRKSNLYVDSGVNINSIINASINKNLSGLECFAGIPSSVGGAVVNSLGAFNHQISDIVEYVICYQKNNLKKRIVLKKDKCNFGYRNSIFKNDNYIITRVKFTLNFDKKSSIIQRMKSSLNKKLISQPMRDYSAGSVFKRSTLIPAKIIDELGLKGKKIGDAEISTKHAGFIINTANAKSKDVLSLVDYINNLVYNEYKQKFDLEIEYVPY